MADISRELQDILDAVYGEEVRGSIHDAIDLINKVGDKNITVGRAVTSSASSTDGYYEGSIYYNDETFILWKCTGSAWLNIGYLKGEAGGAGAWVFDTQAEWEGFDKSNLSDNDTIMFMWDRTNENPEYMSVTDYVGEDATGSVHDSDRLQGHTGSYYATSSDLGTLKFRINSNAAQYSKDGGTTWANFRNPTGTATSDKVLVGNTFANSASDSLTGTMANKGAFVGTITEKDGTVAIPEGYHNGSGYVTATYETGGLPAFVSGAYITFSAKERSYSNVFEESFTVNIPSGYRDKFATDKYDLLITIGTMEGVAYMINPWTLTHTENIISYDSLTGNVVIRFVLSQTIGAGAIFSYENDEDKKLDIKVVLLPKTTIDKGSVEI